MPLEKKIKDKKVQILPYLALERFKKWFIIISQWLDLGGCYLEDKCNTYPTPCIFNRISSKA